MHCVREDEFRTSKLCACCKSTLITAGTAQPRIRSSYRVRRCPNPQCLTLWNRDTNAAVNILDRFLKTKKPHRHLMDRAEPSIQSKSSKDSPAADTTEEDEEDEEDQGAAAAAIAAAIV